MGELIQGRFGQERTPLTEGLSKNGVIELVHLKDAQGNARDWEIKKTYPNVIEDVIEQSNIQRGSLDLEIIKWKNLLRTKRGSLTFIRTVVNSTSEDWKREPTKYMGLVVVLLLLDPIPNPDADPS